MRTKVPKLHQTYSELQHESHNPKHNRHACPNNTPCSASSHHCVLRRRYTGPGWLDRREAEGLGRCAVAESMARSGSRIVALISSSRDRHDRKGDCAVQFCLDRGGGSFLLGPLRWAGVRSLASSWCRRTGAAPFVLARAGRARTGASRFGL